MYAGDRSRKSTLVEFGFRLPSALDNRPLTFEEFEDHINQVIYVSATPGPYELGKQEQVVEQIIRPTGLVDPEIIVRPIKGQIDDLLSEIHKRIERNERTLVLTLTKKMAEDLTDYLKEVGIKVQYIHSEVQTMERSETLRDLRLGTYDVLVGINLLKVWTFRRYLCGNSGCRQRRVPAFVHRLIQTIGRAAETSADRLSCTQTKSQTLCETLSTRPSAVGQSDGVQQAARHNSRNHQKSIRELVRAEEKQDESADSELPTLVNINAEEAIKTIKSLEKTI